MIVRVPIYLDVEVDQADASTSGLLATRYARRIATAEAAEPFLSEAGAAVLNVGQYPIRYPDPP